MNENGRIPLGICKQAIMKLDSFLTDINSIKEDESLTDEEYEKFNLISENACAMMALITCMVIDEVSEEEFENMAVPMDPIDPYPEQKDMPLDDDDGLDIEDQAISYC